MAYLLDSKRFIQAKNLHYGFELLPAVLEPWLENANAGLRTFSIERWVQNYWRASMI